MRKILLHPIQNQEKGSSPEDVIETGLWCSTLSLLLDELLLLTGLSGILFPCESMKRPLELRTRVVDVF